MPWWAVADHASLRGSAGHLRRRLQRAVRKTLHRAPRRRQGRAVPALQDAPARYNAALGTLPGRDRAWLPGFRAAAGTARPSRRALLEPQEQDARAAALL